MEVTINTRFNLVIEILMVDRNTVARSFTSMMASFNLVIEILMVDRADGYMDASPLDEFQSRNRDSYG